MSNLEQWHRTNDEYLARSLAWLRLRLERLQRSTPALLPPTPPKTSWWRWLFPEAPVSPQTSSPPAVINSDDTLQWAEAAMVEAANTTPAPALVQLARRFGLSIFEQQVLLLCAAIDLDTRIPGLCARAQGLPEPGYPTFALALTLFDQPAWDVLSPERPLRYWRLIEINQPGAQPLTTSPLRADERIVNWIKGLNYLDDRLVPLLAPMTVDHSTPLPASLTASVQASLQAVELADQQQQPSVIQLVGSDPETKQLVAQTTAAQLGLALYRLPLDLLPSSVGELETLSRLWQRESLLFPFTLYLDAHGLEATGPERQALNRFLLRNRALVFLSTREAQRQLAQPTALIDVPKPSPVEQRSLWQTALGEVAPTGVEELASQFNLSPAAISQIAQEVLANPAEATGPTQGQLWNACLAKTRPQLDALAQRLDPKATWKDIVLTAEADSLLHQITDQVRQRHRVYETWGFHQKMNRGLGISALFAGESGTGKTMAAEVIANELQLNLYRIDLSSVVSKYIGETEKNLRQLFDAAEEGGAILFFDEADALFGKRSEVKDSHDRYANIEVNYLLQRMEAFSGLAILATNLKSALDTAFVRRLRFIVTFPFPQASEREQIWHKVFPHDTPVQDLDYPQLARLELSGGSIHNIALSAAFLAAKNNSPVTMPLVLTAARTEYRKLGKPMDEITLTKLLEAAPTETDAIAYQRRTAAARRR